MKSNDLGIKLVHEFHEIFGAAIGNTGDPSVPNYSDRASYAMLSDYQLQAGKLGNVLKSYAERAKREKDENGALLLIRLQLIQEELSELAEAMIRKDIVTCFDALVDLSYVVDGTYIALGLHEYKEAGLLEVHRSNMSKLDKDGKPIISKAGRVVKSDLYSKPDLKSILEDRK